MTTATRTAGPAQGPAPIEYPIPLRKGTYLARIVGPHGRYGLDRDFLEGKTNKKAGRTVHQLRPGWYEYQHKPGERSILAVDSAGQVTELDHPGTDRDALRPLGKAAKRGGLIDTPGEYGSPECWCGQPSAGPAPKGTRHEGRARCAEHMPPAPGDTPPPPVYDPEPDTLDTYEPAPDIPADWLAEWHEEGRTE